MMKIPNEMMQCKNFSGLLGLRKQKDCVLEIQFGELYSVEFNQSVNLNSANTYLEIANQTVTFTKEKQFKLEVSSFFVVRLINYYLVYLDYIFYSRKLLTTPCSWIFGLFTSLLNFFASAINLCLSLLWVVAIGVILPGFILFCLCIWIFFYA